MNTDIVSQEQAQQYLTQGYWDQTIQLDYLYRHAHESPMREKLVDSRKRLTFAEVVKNVERLALKFHELGVRLGDRIGIQLPLCVDSHLVSLAVQAVGAVTVHLHLRSRELDWIHLLEATEAVAMVVPAQTGDFDFRGMAEDLRARYPAVKHIFVSGGEARPGTIALEDVFCEDLENRYAPDVLNSLRPEPSKPWTIMSSSGTTGVPKFTVVSSYPSMFISRSLAERFGMKTADVALIISPGGPGGSVASPAGLVGAKIVFLERFDAESALEVAHREKATIVAGTATQFIKMVDVGNVTQRYDLSSLRMVTNAAASLPVEIAQRIEQQLGVRVMNIYGTTDAGIPASTSLEDPSADAIRSAGKPLPGVEVKSVDEEGNEVPVGEVGEIIWRGPCMYGGYYKNPSLNKTKYRNGWYFSGDMGSMDKQGYLTLSGRKDHTINRGGQKISPVEIEECLYQHPKVKEVAVVPMPDRLLGQKACAYVIPREGETFTFDEMIQFLKSRGVAVYKLPERLEIMDQFPVTGGIPRVMKKSLIEDITRKLSREGARNGI